MKKVLLILFTAFIYVNSFSQSTIKGTVTDSVEKKNPENAVIALIRQNDSALIQFTRAGKSGQFSFNNLPIGKYIIMVTHPYMGDYFENLNLKEGENNLGNIFMTPKTKLLADVIVRSGSPIRIKGDTTVYTADSFKVRAGANVEELLRRLPGIQVDKDGKITAMGEKVTKVLVDGEEFFGSDPGIATKNLRADAVKEVQVFDKKSDQAEFTGIDDGVKDKTINLKMKQQKGYFGKVELGGGIKDKYSNSAMVNAFKNKRKLAAYGIMSNTGQTNLDWQDAQNYGGSSGMEMGMTEDGGGMYMSMTYSDDEYFGGGENGIPQNWSGGLHYSNKFGKDNKQSFNNGYKYNKVNAPMKGSTFSRTFLPDSSWLSNSYTNRFNSTVKHAYNLTMDLNIDSANSLKWKMDLNRKNTKSNSHYFSESLTENKDSINNSDRNSNPTGENSGITSSLLWRHKFKKVSRTLSVNADFAWNKSTSDGLLYSLNKYYDNGLLQNTDTTDQRNLRHNQGSNISTKIAYTEPLAKDFYMELSYAFSYKHNANDRITNKKDINGKYEERIDSLSNDFIFNQLANTPGINFRVNKKKYNFSFGTAVAFSHFVQQDLSQHLERNYNYTNFFPRFSYSLKPKSSQNFRINYNGSTSVPTLDQLQPIKVNTDPLNIFIGNPNLKQSFQHSLNMNFGSYNVLKEKGLWSTLNFNTTQNAFVQSSVVDSVGKRIYQTVNANGNYNLSLYSDFNFKLSKSKIRLGMGPTADINRRIEFLNNIKNITQTTSYGIRVNAGKFVENKYDFNIAPTITFNKSKASINTAANSKYWQLETWASARVYFLKKFELNTNVNLEIRQKDPRFTQNNNYTTWNAGLTKRFFKDNALEVSFSINDILDENRGYSRNFSSYSFTENYYTTLRRFWLVTLRWNISKNGKPASGF